MRNINTLIVTGGAGFIGSTVVRQLMNETDITLINIDVLTYAEKIGKRLASPLTDGIEGSAQGVFVC